MVRLQFVNIVIDEFSQAKRVPAPETFLFFLTHWHADHYMGLPRKWPHGRNIFCSEVTRKLMILKYPKLVDNVVGLNVNEWTDMGQGIRVLLVDSNHMAGSVMVLIEGPFGRILHTGDMRFHPKIIGNSPQLFPDGRCLEIDEVHLDNTYSDPVFTFPLRSKAAEFLCELISTRYQKLSRLFLATDSIGKEELFVLLARKYNTKIVVNKDRMNYIKCMKLDYPKIFTLNKSEGWIECIRKKEIQEKLAEVKGSISVTLTGWANINHYHETAPHQFVIPYSLHSNFEELQLFMKNVRPGLLKPVVRNRQGQTSSKINRINGLRNMMSTLCHIKQRGMPYFEKEYVDQQKMSEGYQLARQGMLECVRFNPKPVQTAFMKALSLQQKSESQQDMGESKLGQKEDDDSSDSD